MKTDLYSRIFSRLEDLIPGISNVSSAGASFYAPSRHDGDMALFCSVSECRGEVIELELAKDTVVDGENAPTQWMKFKLDRAERTAVLLACQSGTRYVTAGDETIYPKAKCLPLNSFAANWLSILVHRQFAFRSVVPTPSFN